MGIDEICGIITQEIDDMKKTWISLFGATVLCLLLSSCAIPKPPNENYISNNLPSEITTIIIENPFDATNADVYYMDVKSVSIEKRQTNEKEDIAYCTVELENEYYNFTKYLRLNYNYYDQGGWILDDATEYEPMKWRLVNSPFASESVLSLLKDFSIVQADEIILDSVNNTIQFPFEVNDTYDNLVVTGEVDVTFEFDGEIWKYDVNRNNLIFTWKILGHWYSPIYCGLYLDIDDVNSENASIEIIYEDLAKDAIEDKKTLYADEKYWHAKLKTENLWQQYTSDDFPYLQISFNFNAYETWDIRIFKDSASAQVRGYPHTELYRVEENPFLPEPVKQQDQLNLEKNIHFKTTPLEDATINKLVAKYFEMVETNDQDKISNYMMESGPYWDDIAIWGEPVKQYTITNIEHPDEFTQSMHDQLAEDIDYLEADLRKENPNLDINIDLDDYAVIDIRAEFENSAASYFGLDPGFFDYRFWFVNNGGTWELFYVDEAL